MQSFIYSANPARVIFGSGTLARLPDEVQRIGSKSPLIISTPRQADLVQQIESLLANAGIQPAGQFDGAVMHTPVHVTAKALEVLKELNADGLISIGGGSTVGLSKALALHTDLPQIVIPTTYSGSEMTALLGQTENGVKTTQTTPKVLPEVVIYDVDLTLSMPSGLSATSGVNALAHAVEALYAQHRNPITDLIAEEGIRALARSLPIIVNDTQNREARSDALYGAWLCATTLGLLSLGLHHKLSHTLGGTFGLGHSETHTVVLPHALSYNAPNVPDAMNKIARALGSEDAIEGLNVLLDKIKVKRALKDIGMPEDGIDKAADLAVKNPYWNPRPVEHDRIREIIRRAWAGEPARADI